MRDQATICSRLMMAAVLALLLGGCATMSQLGVGENQPLDEATVTAGLKEALKVGTVRAAAQVGSPGGYLDSSLLHIPLPPNVQDVAATLRRVGLGQKADELEIAMNRAAEQGAAAAVDVFASAILDLTLEDAWGILRGSQTAATDYFRSKTTATLTSRYRPIVDGKLHEVGGYQQYTDLVQRLQSLPMVDVGDLDLVGYVTGKALDGLFTVLAQEERRIREDPVARTTDLLRRVFSAR